MRKFSYRKLTDQVWAEPNKIVELKPSEKEFYEEESRSYLKPEIRYYPGLQKAGARELLISHLRESLQSEQVSIYDEQNGQSEESTVGDFLDKILAGETTKILFAGNVLEKNEKIKSEVDAWTWMPWDQLKKKINFSRLLFCHGKGMASRLHADFGRSVSIQIEGRKTWYFISPRDTVKLMPEVSRNIFLMSKFRTIDEVLENNLGLTIYKATLGPGDVVFFPSFFWHFTRAEQSSVSVSVKWTRLSTLLLYPFLSFIILTARQPSLLSFFYKKKHEPARF